MTSMTDDEEDEALAELTKLKKAIRLGIKSVTYRDRTVTYRSISEMRLIRRDLESELGISRAPKTWWAYSAKGTT